MKDYTPRPVDLDSSMVEYLEEMAKKYSLPDAGKAVRGLINYARENPDKGNETPVKGHIASSECSFSGLEDGSEGEQPYAPGNTQGWGGIVSGAAQDPELPGNGVAGAVDLLHSFGPGVNCRGNLEAEG